MSKNYVSLNPEELSTQEMHKHLLASVAPRPIALASTIDAEGNVNLSPFSFFNVFSANPPIMIFSPSRSGRDNSEKHTYLNAEETREVCISVVTYDMVEQVSLSSSMYPEDVNEFVKSGLTEQPSDLIRPPRVAESPVSFECTVEQIVKLGENAGAGNLIICKVVRIHIQDDILNESGLIDTTKLDLVGRMGGMWYDRASGPSLFSIPKPLSTPGIGVDSLPDHARKSDILTGNDLGRLGNMERIPSEAEMADFELNSDIQRLLSDKSVHKIHALAKTYLLNNENENALKTLFCLRD